MAGDIILGSPSVDVTLFKFVKPGNGDEKTSSKKHTKAGSAVEHLKSSICKHQGEITQGIYLSLEYHKRLRIAYETGDPQAASDSMHALENVSERHFREAWKATVEYLHTYFSSTRDSYQFLPRICLKGTASDSKGNTIIDIYRGEPVERSNRTYLITDNTAFDYVKKKGTAYLTNNIPEEVCQGKYINPRLNQSKAIHYCRDNAIKRFIRKKREICLDWGKCWDDHEENAPLNYYRSTLVIPLTLINNELDADFVNSTIIGIARDVERTIYGFLCFDHPATGYFHDNDIAIGYICADLLSFHLINRQALIHGSQTVEQFCKENGYSQTHRC